MDTKIDEITRLYFTIIDNHILDCEELSGMEQITYVHLKRYASSNGECFPAILTLCKKLKYSENTIRKILKSLEVKGFISIKHRAKDSNKYKFLPYKKFPKEIKETIMDEEEIALAAVFNFYENNINPNLVTIEKDSLKKWLEKVNGNSQLIIKAISIAVSENVRKLKYIEAILKDWYENGIQSVEQADNYIKVRALKRSESKTKKVDSFNDCEQRSYDYERLEKGLLGLE